MSRPTVRAAAQFDAEEDAKAIHGAIKMMGMDENVLIDILSQRSSGQRVEIAEKYKGSFGKSLADVFQSKLSGNFRTLMKLLIMPRYKAVAKCLYEAMSGVGTDEMTILQVLCTAKNKEIKCIKEAYQEVLRDKEVKDPSRNLEKDLVGDLSGPFEKLMIALLQGDREELDDEKIRQLLIEPVDKVIDMEKMARDLDDIYDAGAGKLGTDEATFIRIFASRSNVHMCTLAKLYKQKNNISLMETIESETSGDFRKALKLVLTTCFHSVDAFADCFKDTMAGLGTKDLALMQLITWRSEDDLQDVAEHFHNKNGKTLESWIRDDTSGDYRKALLALIGSNWREK